MDGINGVAVGEIVIGEERGRGGLFSGFLICRSTAIAQPPPAVPPEPAIT